MNAALIHVKASRAGFIAGIRATSSGKWTATKQKAAENLAAGAFPMPTIERPRLVKVPSLHGTRWDVEYKVERGLLWRRCLGAPRPPHGSRFDPQAWTQSNQTEESLVELLDLFQNPTETVEVQ